MFRREAQVLESLDIPGVAKFYEAAECLDDNPPCAYIVQEYIPGKNLAQLIKDCHRFTLDAIYDILIQTLRIIDQLHRHEPPIIHRDIKPSNIMLSPDGKVTIIDFGAVANPQVQGGGSTVAGTIGFMPPEQLMGKPVPASDIYALGAVAIQLITGIHPADIPTQDFYLIFEPLMQDKPHALVQLLREMLEPKVEQRLSDIPEITKQFEHLRNSEETEKETTAAHKRVLSNNNYTQSYEERLEAVESICQTGNVDIWQQLPESTPRPFPEVYRHFVDINPNDTKEEAMPEFDPNTVLLSVSKNYYEKTDKWGDHYINILSIIFTVILFTVLHKTGVLPFSISFWRLVLVVVALVVFYFLILFYSIWGIFPLYRYIFEPLLRKSIHNKEVDLDNRRSSLTTSHLSSRELLHLPNDFKELFCNGRKTIATIVDIQYIEYHDFDINIRTEQPQLYICLPTPCFKVSYSFNPPDDKRKENIIHSFLTDIEPENHYKLRDALPILYSLKNMNSYDMVTSMPFPLPFIDLQYLTHIIDRSFSNFDFNQKITLNNDNNENHNSNVDKNTDSPFYSYSQKLTSFQNITELLSKTDTFGNNTLLGYQAILDKNDFYPIHHIYISRLFRSCALDVNKETYKVILHYLAQTPRSHTQPTALAVNEVCKNILFFKDDAQKENISKYLIKIFKDVNTSKEVRKVLRFYKNDILMPQSFRDAIPE